MIYHLSLCYNFLLHSVHQTLKRTELSLQLLLDQAPYWRLINFLSFYSKYVRSRPISNFTIQRLLVQMSKHGVTTGGPEMSKSRISMSTNSEALLCRFIFRTQRPFTDHLTVTADRTHRTAATWHNRSARSLKEAMELFWP